MDWNEPLASVARDRSLRDYRVEPAPHHRSDLSNRLRSPAEQAEIDQRVAIYARQVEETGRILWLPRKRPTS